MQILPNEILTKVVFQLTLELQFTKRYLHFEKPSLPKGICISTNTFPKVESNGPKEESKGLI